MSLCHSFAHRTHTDWPGIKPEHFIQRALLWYVDERIILKWIFRAWDGACSGLIWLRTGTGGGLL